MTVRAYIDVAQQLKMSLGILFVDLSTAFASVVRALTLPTDVSDDSWKARLRANGFSDVEADEVVHDVHANNEWIAAGGSIHLQALLKELHVGTWAATEGLAGVVHFQSGTLAGTPAADLVFIAAFARVLKRTRRALDDAGLLQTIDATGADHYFGDATLAGIGQTLHDVDYMDDTAFQLSLPPANCCGRYRRQWKLLRIPSRSMVSV